MNIDVLDSLVEEHWLTKRKHPTEDLWIYNYTPKCQYSREWTEETMMCRGLILDGDGRIVARPFKKFFNVGEMNEKIPDGSFVVQEKLDGSLGILYWVGDTPYISTRGSFESVQAKEGTKMLHSTDWFNRKYTYLFEIIYPDNRIVVDYGKARELVLLAVVDTETGGEVEVGECPYRKAKVYDGIKDISDLERLQNDKDEGFVLRWEDGFRLKFKLDEYVRLHRLITQVTARSIWDLLRNKQPFDELLERVPDEFYTWVKEKKEFFETEFRNIKSDAKMFLEARDLKGMDRKDAAQLIMEKKKDISAVIFKMLDDKNVDDLIWKMLRPAHETPFKQIT
jgi:RNA ligase